MLIVGTSFTAGWARLNVEDGQIVICRINIASTGRSYEAFGNDNDNSMARRTHSPGSIESRESSTTDMMNALLIITASQMIFDGV